MGVSQTAPFYLLPTLKQGLLQIFWRFCLAYFKTFIIRLSFPLRFLRHIFSSGKSRGVDSALVLPSLASGPEGVCTDGLLLFQAWSRFSVDTGFR